MSKKKPSLPKIGKKTLKNNFEFQVYKEINNLKPRGSQLDYETEKLAYVIESEYIPDFVLTRRDGTMMYIEAKGAGRSFDSIVQRKMKAVKAQHPDKDIRIVFHRDAKIGAKRKDGSFKKQSDWARENGFIFAVNEIPKEWFN